MLGSLTIAPNQWPTSAVIDWVNMLKRVSDVPQREQAAGRGHADPARRA
jgi:hypothetical protein